MEELKREHLAYLKAEEKRKDDEARKMAHALEALATKKIDMEACARAYRDEFVRLGFFRTYPGPAACTAGPIRVADAYSSDNRHSESILKGVHSSDINRHLRSDLASYDLRKDADVEYYVCVRAGSLFQ
jgi:hypothetical protein